MTPYTISQLADYFGIDKVLLLSDSHLPINELRLDSRKIEQNDLFIALKGLSQDGRDYIHSAIELGAIAILAEADNQQDDKTLRLIEFDGKVIPQFNLYQLDNQLSAFANDFYDNPSAKMRVVGVTGTNGKTTISQLVAQWATLFDEKSASLGTLGNGLYNQLVPSANTTSSAVEIQSMLASFQKQGVKLVTMEVSSHGLALGRVKDVTFAASLYTNLSRDHLDFHHTMQAYEQAKWSLFTNNKNELAVKVSGKKVINYDDEVGAKWIKQLDDAVVVSANPQNLSNLKELSHPYVGVKAVSYHERGATISVCSSWGDADLESSLFGAFNVSNLLVAYAAMLSLDYAFDELSKTVSQLQPVCGRMEIFTNDNKPTVIVDYSHTPDALEKALDAAKSHCEGNLWAIFGCGGDRDRGKRPIMAEVAEKLADKIIVTNDNPRTEDQDQIINDILVGFTNPSQVQVIKDRATAIKSAAEQSQSNDIILVAGKGHEDYQVIGKTKHHYSDRETAELLLGIKK